MASASFELRFEISEDEPWPDPPTIDYQEAVMDFVREFIAAKFFQDEVNQGLQVEAKVCIAVTSHDATEADFEVLDGYASPSLRNSDTQFAIDS
ncbi:MAG: hypothetical protein IH618_15705 [Ignavibacteriaceae bacterium]|nr:hypothetical protein [Ignavibacteriaceae bacterium]